MMGDVESATEDARKRFRSFADAVVAPHASAFEDCARIDGSVISELANEGYLAAGLPASIAPDALDMFALGILHEEIGRVSSSLRSLLTVHAMVCFATERWSRETVRQEWLARLASGQAMGAFCLTEADAGSDVTRASTTASPTPGGGYVLNGHKIWITGGQVADLFLVFASTERGLSAFLVPGDTPGVRRTPVHDVLGTRASMVANISFEDCHVGDDFLVGGEGTGLSTMTGALDIGRYSVACGSVGIVQGCLEASLDHASSRYQGGALLEKHQLIQRMVTQMEVDATAARLLCRRAGELKDGGDPATLVATCVAKYYASTAATRAAQNAVQIHGATGCSDSHPVAQYFRDAKIMEIIEGSTQIQETLIAEDAFRRHA